VFLIELIVKLEFVVAVFAVVVFVVVDLFGYFRNFEMDEFEVVVVEYLLDYSNHSQVHSKKNKHTQF